MVAWQIDVNKDMLCKIFQQEIYSSETAVILIVIVTDIFTVIVYSMLTISGSGLPAIWIITGISFIAPLGINASKDFQNTTIFIQINDFKTSSAAPWPFNLSLKVLTVANLSKNVYVDEGLCCSVRNTCPWQEINFLGMQGCFSMWYRLSGYT